MNFIIANIFISLIKITTFSFPYFGKKTVFADTMSSMLAECILIIYKWSDFCFDVCITRIIILRFDAKMSFI